MKKLILVGLSAIVLGSSFLYAQEPMNDNGSMKQKNMKKHPPLPIAKHLKMLNLSDEQKAEVEGIFKECRENAMKNAATLPTRPLKEALTSDSFDKAKYISIQKEKSDNFIEKQANATEKIYNVLNAEQKAKLKEIVDAPKVRKMKNQ